MDRTRVSCIGRQVLYRGATREARAGRLLPAKFQWGNALCYLPPLANLWVLETEEALRVSWKLSEHLRTVTDVIPC